LQSAFKTQPGIRQTKRNHGNWTHNTIDIFGNGSHIDTRVTFVGVNVEPVRAGDDLE